MWKVGRGRFDGGLLSSDGGLLALREIEGRLRLSQKLPACLDDPRRQGQVMHSLADIIRFRLLMIAAGYEDGNDASELRYDPLFKMALDRLPSGEGLCSQSTISRLENLANVRALLAMGHAFVDFYCNSFRQVQKRIILDIDDTFDAAYGDQQLSFFNAHYDEYGFLPIVVFDGEGRFVTAMLRPAYPPKGKAVRAFLRRLGRAIRANWPNTAILVRGDSHDSSPEVLDWCHAEGVDYILGVPPRGPLRRHVNDAENRVRSLYKAAPKAGKMRRFKEFYDGARSWSRVERIIGRIGAGEDGVGSRFIVTSLTKGSPRHLYERVYCARGQMENHIKAWKTHLAADRTSCSTATANQFRLFLHAAAYWLLWTLRSQMPPRSSWRGAQFDTLRLRLIKLAVRVVELKRQIKVHLPTATPLACQTITRHILGRMPRLVT